MKRLIPIAVAAAMLVTGFLAEAQTAVKVRGLGIFGNLDMERRLRFLSGTIDESAYQLSPRELEDSVYIILQQLRRDGHPGPRVSAEVGFEDGSRFSHEWSLPFSSLDKEDKSWPRITEVAFTCDYYRSVKVDGVSAIDE
jgi:hypothetical protein